jgi:hypothetical protein
MSTANGAPQGCENHVAVFFIAFSLFEQVRMAADAKAPLEQRRNYSGVVSELDC